jgi:hypothetical protein
MNSDIQLLNDVSKTSSQQKPLHPHEWKLPMAKILYFQVGGFSNQRVLEVLHIADYQNCFSVH